MLKRLRWQLSLLYLLAAIGLVVLIGSGSYSLILHYFQNTNDLAMQYKMATEFEQLSLPLTLQLASARETWIQNNAQLVVSPKNTPTSPVSVSESDDGEGEEGGFHNETEENPYEEVYYDARLSALFVLPLGATGDLLYNPNPAPLPMSPNDDARISALRNGYDWRTVSLADGTRVRLLTYFTNSSNPQIPAYLQIGRLLSDQDRVLSQFLTGLILLGGISVILLGAGSWWMSGRSLGPAQRAWDQQQAFISNASHELRTPLTLIKATAEFGLRSHPDDTQRDLLQDVLNESDYMSKLVDDLLLLSRLDTHRLKLNRELIDIPNLLKETQHQIEKIAGDKDVNLILGELQGTVWGDPTRMRQVLLILLDNALRYTPSGGVIKMEANKKGKIVQVIVADNGSGIASQHLPHLFERFYQADRSGGEDGRSNGLGLSIAKALIEAQGGSIHLDSQPGEGTHVTLSLQGAG